MEWIARIDTVLWQESDCTGRLARIPEGAALTLERWCGICAAVTWNGQAGYILACDLQPDAPIIPDGACISPSARYTHEQLMEDVKTLRRIYPDAVTVSVAGVSEAGREIPVLRIGAQGARYQVLLQGAIHGREHMTAWLLMAMAEHWLIRGLTEDVCWHILPMTNPDGAAISQGAFLGPLQTEIYRRDQAAGCVEEPPSRYAARWKANGLGVDLNRNFPSGWEPISGPLAPSSQRYKGPAPFSAAEAAVLRDYALSQHFDVTLSYHATGSVIYWEYGGKKAVNARSHALAQAVQAVTGYVLEGSDSVEGGGFKDWAMDALEIPSLTIEIGSREAPLDGAELPAIFARNCGVLPAVARWLREKNKENDHVY